MRRLANPDNLAAPTPDGWARPAMRARTSYNPLGGGHRTAADGGRGVRLSYLLTTPTMGWRSTAEADRAEGQLKLSLMEEVIAQRPTAVGAYD